MISFANVVVYNYQYLLDPKIAQLVSSSMQRECVVVFDEAHNIDNICIEVMSINFRLPTLDAAQRNLGKLRSDVDRLKATDARRLNDEYQRLVAGLATQGALPANEELASSPVLPADILQQAVPGNLRRADRSSASSPASSPTCAGACRATSSSSRRRPPSSRG